ncbi:MAG TPA: DUF4157 domain-containing protein [Pyrinomonadaceae bacterium]|nr:DUF4157 domain-containing protein [Pyrinomonadaceae bacterium]
MSPTSARTTTKVPASTKPKALPPARSFAQPSRAAGSKFIRAGGEKVSAQRPRFPLPKEFRRSVVANQVAPVSSLLPRPENIITGEPLISGVQFLNALDHLPQRETKFHNSGAELHPWSFPEPDGVAVFDRESSANITGAHPTPLTAIQFAQLPANQILLPPALPLVRPSGRAVMTHSLKRVDATAFTSTGAPLPVAMRNALARTFSVELSPIRIHTDASAQRVVRSLSTRAFAYGNHIFLGPGEQPTDLRLIAHEVAHVVQQASGVTIQHFTPGFGDPLEHEAERASTAAVRGERFNVQQRTRPRAQGYGLGDLAKDIGIDVDPLDWLAGKANIIPGFRMFTIVLGVNPINMSGVDRSAANILRALVEFMPGGGLITEALDNSGVFEKAGALVEQQISALGMTGAAIKAAVTTFIDRLSLKRIVTEPGTVWEEAKQIFTGPIDQIISCAKGLVSGIIDLIKDAILKPIAKLAEGTAGYDLLKGILGKDPITGEEVTPSAETLLGPLLKMIGLGDVWQKMQDAKAIPRAWAWFKSTMSQLKGFVSQIPDLFIAAFKALTIEDIILVPKAFAKLAGVFGGFIGKFVSWGVDAMFKLLEIVFDVVSPGAFAYVKKTAAALKSILQNPLPFVGNLVNAAKLGFTNFAGNILTHLKKGLIDWLTGSLEGVYIPTALTLPEFGKMAISILGVSWAQIRGKIVKALGPNGETIMKGLETAFDIVMALINGGPKAAWEVIKEKLTDLKDTIVQGIIDFVKEAIVTKAVPKLIAMFIPGAGFISAIMSIYDTVMVFVEKISKIAQVVSAFINSIVQIAAGNIGAAAAKVENILAGLLSLAISFLAGFVGLGKVTSKIKDIIKRLQAAVDKAIETAVNWIINKAKSLFKTLFGKNAKDGDPEKEKLVQAGLTAIDTADQAAMKDGDLTREAADKVAVTVKGQHPIFKSLTVIETQDRIDYDYVCSPGKKKTGVKKGTVGPLGIKREMLGWEEATHKAFASSALWKKAGAVPGDYQGAKLDIRHRVSISDTIRHTESAISPKTIDVAVQMMTAKGFKPDAKNRPAIIGACKQFLTKANNDLSNLFLGDLSVNRLIGKRYDPGKKGKADDVRHDVQKGDFVETWGFKGEEFLITIERKSKRRGTEDEFESWKGTGSRDKPAK